MEEVEGQSNPPTTQQQPGWRSGQLTVQRMSVTVTAVPRGGREHPDTLPPPTNGDTEGLSKDRGTSRGGLRCQALKDGDKNKKENKENAAE